MYTLWGGREVVTNHECRFVYGAQEGIGGNQPLCAAARATTSNTLKMTDGDMLTTKSLYA